MTGANQNRSNERSEADGRHLALSPRRLIDEFAGLYAWLPRTQKRRFVLVCLLAVIGALAESLTIALLIPFLAFVMDIAGAGAGILPDGLTAWLGMTGDGVGSAQPLTLIASLLALSIVIGAAARYALLATKLRLVETCAHDIGSEIFARAIGQPYAQFVTRNSSEFVAGVEKVRGLTMGVLSPAIDALTALVMGAIIGLALVLLEPVVALWTAVVLGILYVAITRLSHRPLKRNSHVLAHVFTERIRMVQEGLGGIRDVKIGQTEAAMVDGFRAIDERFRDAKVESGLITQAPGLVIEAIALAGLIVAAAVFAGADGLGTQLVPLIGAMAYGLRRLMPLWQQIYLVRSSFSTYSGLLADVRELLAIPLEHLEAGGEPVPPLAHAVEFRSVGFTYEGSVQPALEAVDLVIERGSRVGLMGRSGAGKSTLVDLFAALLSPTQGEILIDGQVLGQARRAAWQAQIAYVPQAIFLIDDTLAANIAFGSGGGSSARHPAIEDIREAARQAEIAQFIEGLPQGYDTRIGERGVRLSGGQRQRIGLARALYRGSNVLILDEATSALDEATEGRIIRSIDRLDRDLTILAIAHRPSTLAFCDRIYQVEGGRILGWRYRVRRGPALRSRHDEPGRARGRLHGWRRDEP